MSAAEALEPALEPLPAGPVYVGGPELPAAARPCRCGHAKAAHEHWRPGRECGACGVECPRYRPLDGMGRRLRARLRGWLG